LVSHQRKFILFKKVKISNEKPSIIVSNKKIIDGEETNKGLRYIVDVALGDTYANLQFRGTNNGFKGRVPGSNWVVMLPKVEVTGEIKVKEKKLLVKGIGYHDHNWGITPCTILNNYGWIWGKLYSKNYTVIWAKVYKTREKGFPLMVVTRENQDGFINIEPRDFKIDLKGVRKQYKYYGLPSGFTITAVKNSDVFIDVDVDVVDVHYSNVLGVIKYWRYHVKNTGVIRLNGSEEYINNVDIAEYLVLK